MHIQVCSFIIVRKSIFQTVTYKHVHVCYAMLCALFYDDGARKIAYNEEAHEISSIHVIAAKITESGGWSRYVQTFGMLRGSTS